MQKKKYKKVWKKCLNWKNKKDKENLIKDYWKKLIKGNNWRKIWKNLIEKNWKHSKGFL
jgi:hypothetical protein